MIHANLDQTSGLLEVTPSGPLSEADFSQLAGIVDPYIEKNGTIAGLLLRVERFPGWENFAGMVNHFKFVREHHTKIKKIAIVTDAPVGKLAENFVSHFVAATIKNFSAAQLDDARAWILSEK